MKNRTNNIKEYIQGKNLILIGETHGSKEIPLIVMDFLKVIDKPIIFCGEFPYQAENDVQSFLKSQISKEKLFSSKYLSDAIYDKRLTEDILLLWQTLFKNGAKIVGLDNYDLENIEDRDKEIAKQLLKNIEKNKGCIHVVYCGGAHLLEKITKIQSFIVRPIKIYLPEKLLKESITIQFIASSEEKIKYNKDKQILFYYLPIEDFE